MDMQRAKKTQSKALGMGMGHAAATTGTVIPINVEALRSIVPNRRGKTIMAQPTASAHNLLTPEENTKFLHFVASCSKITTHYELFLLVRGELQYFLPQAILIAAWGDFSAQDPQVDVISNLPGVRTDRICENIIPLAKRLHKLWTDGGAQAMVLDKRVAEVHACSKHDCAQPCAFPGMRFALVHGTRNKRDGYDSLYFALSRRSAAINGAETRLRLLADSIIHQIDVAYRRVAALRIAKVSSDDPSLLLSGREEEITSWVCQGKTNAQIAQILGISVNTVKNHVQRIFDKLGANNRTQAVAKYKSVAGRSAANLAHSDS